MSPTQPTRPALSSEDTESAVQQAFTLAILAEYLETEASAALRELAASRVLPAVLRVGGVEALARAIANEAGRLRSGVCESLSFDAAEE